MPQIVVVGAGIVGASLAYHLARKGASVTVFDAAGIAAGATGRAFGWINIATGAPSAYSSLRQLAAGEWRRLERELAGALGVTWCGALTWHCDLADTERFASERTAEGYGVRLVGRNEIADLEPGLVDPPRVAAHAADEGMLDPSRATEVLLRAAEGYGAQICLRTSVRELLLADGRVRGVHTAEGEVAADQVLLAGGVGVRALCEPLGADLLLHGSPAILLRYRTPGPLLRGIVSAPDLEVRQGSAGLMLGAANHIAESGDDGPEGVAARGLEAVRCSLRRGAEVTLLDVAVGLRPMPSDRWPVVGSLTGVEGVYVAVMHSGVTMAPLIGRLAAEEIVREETSELLQPFRPGRFAQTTPG